MGEHDIRSIGFVQRLPAGVAMVLPEAVNHDTIEILMILPKPGKEARPITVSAQRTGTEGVYLEGKIGDMRIIREVVRNEFRVNVTLPVNASDLPDTLNGTAVDGVSRLNYMQEFHGAPNAAKNR
jgi:hypothetical protein